jgi:hypothetical protein
MTLAIKTSSLLYQFLDTNFATSDEYIPRNLCPFMRKVMYGITVTTFVFTLIAVAASLMLLSLIAVFVDYSLWGPTWVSSVVFGAILWLIAIGIGFMSVWVKFCERYHFMSKAADAVTSINTVQTVAYWIRTTHDKICPRLVFYTPEGEEDYE